MPKRNTGRVEGYLLPLFVDNLRKALDLSQETLQNEYIDLLEKSLISSVDELLSELRSCISTDENNTYSKMRLSSCSDKKSVIGFYYELRKDIEALRSGKKKIEKNTYETIANKINMRLASFCENTQLGSHGGIEVRTIRNFLNYEKEPSGNRGLALHFVMTRLFPNLFLQQSVPSKAHLESRFFNGTLESQESITSRLLSIDEQEIDDETVKNAIIDKLFLGKATYERLKKKTTCLTEEEKKKLKETAYTELFEDIWQQINIPCSVTYNRHEHYYSIGATLTKSILTGLLGVENSIAKKKWDEISNVVYKLVLVAEEQSNELSHRHDSQTEMLSSENIFITEFLILFFSNKIIREAMNKLPFMGKENSEDTVNE